MWEQYLRGPQGQLRYPPPRRINCFRAKRGQCKRVDRPESQGQSLALTVLFVSSSFIASVQLMWEQYLPAPQGQLGCSPSRPNPRPYVGS